MQDQPRRPYQRRQKEEAQTNIDNNTRLLIGAIIVAVILCLVLSAVLVSSFTDGILPTRVTEAEIDLTANPGGLPTPTLAPPTDPIPGGRSIGDPYIPELGNTGYDVQRYTLRLALDPASRYIQGTTTIEALATLHGLSELSLDFVGYNVSSILVDGQPAESRREGKKLVVTLPALLATGQAFSMVIDYDGSPTEETSLYLRFVDHLGLHYPDQQSLFIIDEPDGARYVFPSNDHPRDKATFRFELLVPEGLTGVANGRLLSSEPVELPSGRNGDLFIWEHNYPMATYLAVIAAGDYERVESTSPQGIPIRHYIFPESAADHAAADIITGEAIDWMGSLFGTYPFEAYGHVTAHVSGVSLETQGMVLLDSGMIGTRTIAHEMAHMWFGDWVSLDSWSEMWRNEGFATYIQIMWETRDDFENLELQIEGARAAVEANELNFPLGNPPAEYLFNYNIYYGGAVAIHELRQEMGDEAFFNGLRLYFQRYGGDTASDAEFQAVMEEVSGKSLSAFFAEWFPKS
jgi:aminopeptidase N